MGVHVGGCGGRRIRLEADGFERTLYPEAAHGVIVENLPFHAPISRDSTLPHIALFLFPSFLVSHFPPPLSPTRITSSRWPSLQFPDFCHWSKHPSFRPAHCSTSCSDHALRSFFASLFPIIPLAGCVSRSRYCSSECAPSCELHDSCWRCLVLAGPYTASRLCTLRLVMKTF